MPVPSFLTLAVAGAATISAATYPVVNTTGGLVQGSGSNYRSDVTVYKGIPFAAPPVGELRWTEPTDPEPWSGVYNATKYGSECIQTSADAAIFTSGEDDTSEDCLYLNVWTPTYNETVNLRDMNLPVYLWYYGGRFEMGSGSVKTYDGAGLAAKGVIVVTMNYRLGAFGWLAHPELSAESPHNTSGNFGLFDQQFALHWVRQNIANFGGNASHITVGGQSSGSASSLNSMWSPLTRDLIVGVIAESGARGPRDPFTGGAATSYRLREPALESGVNFLKEYLNVSSIAEARNVSASVLNQYDTLSDTTYDGTQFENLTSLFADPPLWRPIIDGYALTHSYTDALKLNDHGDVPILTGNNADEGAQVNPDISVATFKEEMAECFQNFSSGFFDLYPANNDTQAGESYNAMNRDLARVGTWRWSVDWAIGGAKSNVYTYYWTHTPAEDAEQGAYHGSELWYVFNNIPYTDYSNVTWTADDYVVQAQMADYWANFIKTGSPNGGNLTYFPPSIEAKPQTMWLGEPWGSSFIALTQERINFIEAWYKTLKAW